MPLPIPAPLRRFGRHRGRWRSAGAAVAVALALTATAAAPASAATPAPASHNPVTKGLDRKDLDRSLAAIHSAGMYGVYSAVRDGKDEWRGAAGVADIDTGRPVRSQMEHRIGSITKTFAAVGILQQVARDRIELDAPIARYLPGVVPGDLGRRITVRMLLNHTSGIGDYIPGAFPSLRRLDPQSIDDNRFRHFSPLELVRYGLAEPRTGEPGAVHVYSNTNYVLAGLILTKVTGQDAEKYLTRHVIRAAGLRHTYFPRTPYIEGPHAKMYESLYGRIDPPRDYSVYDMSWAWALGSLVSTTADLNQFYRALLTGKLLAPAELREMQTTVPVRDATGRVQGYYGLGLAAQDLPCGRFWGHSGAVFGAGTYALTSQDGRRQVSLGINLMKYQRLDADPSQSHPVDAALNTHIVQALCGKATAGAGATGALLSPMETAVPAAAAQH
ncbi:serine hydrolase [Streptomyces rimosus]|uniref:serine hydrolase domain-containing protein n=1 Tax=Streptomyces rimosus TaxID=1927 RepID=UPI0004C7025F|nr:serine hydrolase domain-containing protein [Streptomyces rimosus]